MRRPCTCTHPTPSRRANSPPTAHRCRCAPACSTCRRCWPCWPGAGSTRSTSRPVRPWPAPCSRPGWWTSCCCTWPRCCWATPRGRCSAAWASPRWRSGSSWRSSRPCASATTCGCGCGRGQGPRPDGGDAGSGVQGPLFRGRRGLRRRAAGLPGRAVRLDRRRRAVARAGVGSRLRQRPGHAQPRRALRARARDRRQRGTARPCPRAGQRALRGRTGRTVQPRRCQRRRRLRRPGPALVRPAALFRRVRARAAAGRGAGGLDLRWPGGTAGAARGGGRLQRRDPPVLATGAGAGRRGPRRLRLAVRAGRHAGVHARGGLAAGADAGVLLELFGHAPASRGHRGRSGRRACRRHRPRLGRSGGDPPPALAAVRVRAEEALIRWGILGCGEVTEVKSGPALQRAPGSALVAVMRRDAARAEDYARRHGVPRWYADADALVADPEVDAVYVASPPSSHAPLAIRALRAGKPVYVEKPMALDAGECTAMLDASRDAGQPLFVAYYRRALPRFLKVRELVAEGAIGQPRRVRVQLHRTLDPRYADSAALPWRVRPELSGGGLFVDLGSHTLDLLDFLLGPVVEASGETHSTSN